MDKDNNFSLAKVLQPSSTETESGNYFDRQKRIPDWDQGVIEKQICFVFGSGGVLF